jgi:hypothetical protein
MRVQLNTWQRLGPLIVLGIVWSGAACSRRTDRPAVCGRYVANHGKGLDALDLKSDGTYIYNCHLNDGSTFHNTGVWKFYYDGKEPRVTFDQFAFCLPGYGGRRLGYWDVEVERSWTGRLRLTLDPDLNYYYERQTQ